MQVYLWKYFSADRRGLGPYLRSNPILNDATGRSRRPSRVIGGERLQSVDPYHSNSNKYDYQQDMEHKRVIDGFGVEFLVTFSYEYRCIAFILTRIIFLKLAFD